MRQQTRGAGLRVGSQQAIEQGANAQHPLTQLAQLEHQVDGNAVGIEVGVNRRGRMTASLQAAQVLLQRVLALGRVDVRAGQKGDLQRHDVAVQGVKGGSLQRRGTHAQTQLR
jgi:hypothetical protein